MANIKLAPGQWIRVTDYTPETGKDVLICTDTELVTIGYLSITKQWRLADGAALKTVTHWQVLPTPPQP